jgi:hypothetical protein
LKHEHLAIVSVWGGLTGNVIFESLITPLVITIVVSMPWNWQFTAGNPGQATEETLNMGSLPPIKAEVSLTKAIAIGQKRTYD